MPRYLVRCCCQPQKILGTLDLAEPVRGREVQVRERIRFPLRSMLDFDPAAPIPHNPIRHHTVKIRIFGLHELAVYSDDRPIEFWRKIEGFTENKNAAGETASGA